MGGAEFCLLDIASNLRESSLVVLLEDGPFRHKLAEAGVSVAVVDAGALHRVRRGSRLPSARAVTSVWRAAREVAAIARDFDVIHANSQKALVVGSLAARRVGTPLVWHLHDIIEPPAFSRLNIALDVWLANHRADRVLAVSQATAAAFVGQGGSRERVHVVYNGIDTRPFEQTPRASTYRLANGLVRVPLIGCFSRLAEWKGQHVLVEAVADLPGAHLLLVGGALFGEHAYEGRLRALVHSRGMTDRVHFLGQRDDVPELMREVDLIVHPSTAPEPFARTLIEAMLSGHPPIASACGGVPELITTGRTGFLFPPGDVSALRSLLQRLLGAPETLAQVAVEARAHAFQHFAMPSFVAAVTGHLQAAASTGKMRRTERAPQVVAT
jgi:glycosyltransferase involved in cell wall biosynthesis